MCARRAHQNQMGRGGQGWGEMHPAYNPRTHAAHARAVRRAARLPGHRALRLDGERFRRRREGTRYERVRIRARWPHSFRDRLFGIGDSVITDATARTRRTRRRFSPMATRLAAAPQLGGAIAAHSCVPTVSAPSVPSRRTARRLSRTNAEIARTTRWMAGGRRCEAPDRGSTAHTIDEREPNLLRRMRVSEWVRVKRHEHGCVDIFRVPSMRCKEEYAPRRQRGR